MEAQSLEDRLGQKLNITQEETFKPLTNGTHNPLKVNAGQGQLTQPEPEPESEDNGVQYVVYESELQMPDIVRLIQKDLSEPYSIYTYRYFIHNWPNLCFMVCLFTFFAM